MAHATTTPAAVDQAALDQAFAALKTFDWGGDRKALAPIDDALTATRGDAAARSALEARLATALSSGVSRAAQDAVCRWLTVIGTAASVPALAALLPDPQLSHMARYALERIPGAEAAAALRDALPKLAAAQKIGAVGSLGVRRDDASIAALAAILTGSDAPLAAAAADALGDIGNEAAAAALTSAAAVPAALKPAVADGALAAAEHLAAEGNQPAARAVYKALLAGAPTKPIQLAALRGNLRLDRDSE